MHFRRQKKIKIYEFYYYLTVNVTETGWIYNSPLRQFLILLFQLRKFSSYLLWILCNRKHEKENIIKTVENHYMYIWQFKFCITSTRWRPWSLGHQAVGIMNEEIKWIDRDIGQDGVCQMDRVVSCFASLLANISCCFQDSVTIYGTVPKPCLLLIIQNWKVRF